MSNAKKTFGERASETVDADLEAVARERLPVEARNLAMANLLGSLEIPYVLSFEKGYAWARQAQLFAMPSSDVFEELKRVAVVYGEKARHGIPAGNDLVGAVLLMRDVTLVTNEDTNPYAMRTRLPPR